MKQYADVFSIIGLCRVLQVSRSGYYAWLNRPESTRSQANRSLLEQLKQQFKASRKTYGVRRLTQALAQQGEPVNHKRVARLKRENGIYPRSSRKRPRTTQADPNHSVAANHLDRQFEQSQANTVWAGDISYLACEQGWLYLAIWLDLFNRKLVGWSLSHSLHTQLIVDAFEQAVVRQGTAPDWVHADRGCQYTSTEFREKSQAHGFQLSMSRKGNCWERAAYPEGYNAVAESFFATLKRECIGEQVFTDLTEARSVLFDYIEVFYNRQRLHSTLGYLSPVQYEQVQLAA